MVWKPRLLMTNMGEAYLNLAFVNVRIWHDLKYALEFLGFPSVFLYASMFTSIWLWLYAGSGFILKAARRFDIGFEWFISKADIEKRPLQSIGLVAGALVAIVYWSAVSVSRVVG